MNDSDLLATVEAAYWIMADINAFKICPHGLETRHDLQAAISELSRRVSEQRRVDAELEVARGPMHAAALAELDGPPPDVRREIAAELAADDEDSL